MSLAQCIKALVFLEDIIEVPTLDDSLEFDLFVCVHDDDDDDDNDYDELFLSYG